MDGQAQASNNISDLASFLDGEPQTEAVDTEDEQAEGEQDNEPSDDAPDESEPEQSADDEEAAEEEDQASGELFEVKLKDESGAVVTEKVTKDDLVAGYLRQKDYTQKTMKLAETERQVLQVSQQKIDEGRNYFLQQAQQAKTAVFQLAGLKSEDELYQLSVQDPAAWVQEQQRMKAINGYLQSLDQSMQQQQMTAAQQTEQAKAQTVAKAWEVLSQKGMTRDKLAETYGKVKKDYGVSDQQLGEVLEPGMVDVMKDALAWRALQNGKPAIAKKVSEADRLPSQKKAIPANERNARALDAKFSKGRAKINDLASFLAHNS